MLVLSTVLSLSIVLRNKCFSLCIIVKSNIFLSLITVEGNGEKLLEEEHRGLTWIKSVFLDGYYSKADPVDTFRGKK